MDIRHHRRIPCRRMLQVEARRVATGGLPGRNAGYLVYQFTPMEDGRVPEKLTFRYLLARRRRPSDASFQAHINAVLDDPSSWFLYEFSIDTREHIVDQIPEEIYNSPNINAVRVLLPALKRIVKACEADGNRRKALEFIRAQGPKTQRLLHEERERLERLHQGG